jgi:hypothetical protein
MSLMALRFAWRCGSIVPLWEEWLYVPCVLGVEPFSLSWLWEQYLEHRYPLHKLVCYVSFSAFGLDERPILLLNVGLFSLLAAALIAAVRRVRGRTVYADAFFPMALLHLGHYQCFYWAATNTYAMSSFLAGMVLVILYMGGGRFTARTAAAAGVCLVLLPLCHGFGLMYAAGLSIGLSGIGLVSSRSEEPTDRRTGRVLLAFSGLALLIVALNFVGYERSRTMTPTGDPRLRTILRGMIGFLLTPFGVGGSYPYDRWTRRGMLVLLAVAGGCVAAGLIGRRAGGRRPAVGLGLFLGTSLVAALATGYGRAPWGPDAASAARYSMPAVPTLLCLYLVWEACGPARLRPFGRAVLCLSILLFLAPNWARGLEEGSGHRQAQEAFLADVRAGMPIPGLIGRHAGDTYYRHDVLERCLRLLRDHRYGDYARIAADPPLREVRLTAPQAAAVGASWDGERGRSTSNAPELDFALPGPTPIAGIRMKYANVNPGGWVPFLAVEFRTVDPERGRHWRTLENRFLKPDGRVTGVGFWLDATVDKVRIKPDIRPCDFTLSDIVLLLPDQPPEHQADRSSGRAVE